MAKTTYILIPSLLAFALSACGGGGAAPGGASSNNSNSISNGTGGTTNNGGAVTDTTLAQSLNRAQNPLRRFTSTIKGYRRIQIGQTNNLRPDAITQGSLALTVAPNGSSASSYRITVKNGAEETIYLPEHLTQAGDTYRTTLSNGNTVSLKSLDGAWNGLLTGRDTSSFTYLRRFEESLNSASESRFRYGVFGIETAATATILNPTSSVSNVIYRGKFDGSYTNLTRPPTAFSRNAIFTVNFARKDVRLRFQRVENINNLGLGSKDLIASGQITGNGFSITGNGFSMTNLSIDEIETPCAPAPCRNQFNDVNISGTFYGNSAQELGGTVFYNELNATNEGGGQLESRLVSGVFAARR